MDRENVIKGMTELKKYLPSTMWEPINNALAMLKEQEDMGKELTDAMELIHKKNERIEKLLKEQEAVVRCKDCKYFKMHKYNDFYKRIWPEDGDSWYECLHPDDDGEHGTRTRGADWFCADGERKCESD